MEETTNERNKIHFTVMAIEAGSKKMNISPMEMYQRLEKVNLLQRLVWGCYDVMHTQSLQHVADDLVEALHNWEERERNKQNNECPIL